MLLHTSHEKSDKSEKHKNEDENKKMLEKFKEKFIVKCEIPLPQFSRHLSCFNEMIGGGKKNVNVYNDSEPHTSESE